jgi:hypothetical protein
VTNVECGRAVRHWLVARGRPIGPEWRAVVEAERFHGCGGGPDTMDEDLHRALVLAQWTTSRATIDAWLAEDVPRGIAAALASGDDGAGALERWLPGASRWHAEALADALGSTSVPESVARRLLDVLLDHPEAGVRSKAAWTCHRRSLVPDDVRRRLEVLLRDEDAEVRSMSVHLLVTAARGLPAEFVSTRLRTALGDRDSNVAHAAAWVIGDLGIESLVPDLVVRVRFDESGCAWPLGRLGASGVRALAEMLRTTKTADAKLHANDALQGFLEHAEARPAAGGEGAASDPDACDDATSAALRTLLEVAGTPFPAALRAESEACRYAALLSVRLPADAAAVVSWAAEPESSDVVRRVGESLVARLHATTGAAPPAPSPGTK